MKSEQLGSPSSHWTTALADQKFFIGLFLLTVFHLWLSVKLAPSEDELYYWTWAKSLQASYFDHPPMVAWLINLSTKIFGDTVFAIRFPACMAAVFIIACLKFLCRGSYLLVLLMFTPLFFLGSVLMTPDPPLLVFWTAYFIWMMGLNQKLLEWSGDPVQRVYHATPIELMRWVFGGVLLGLGFLSKYSMAIAVPCAFAALISRYRVRAWMTGFAVHLLVAGIVAFPVFYYNYENHFIPFQFQWGNSVSGSGFQFSRLFEFLGGQIAIVGALPFLLLPWLLADRQELDKDNRMHVCFYFFVLPILFFLFQSFRTKLEANWALVAYISFWPMAQRIFERSSFPLIRHGLIWSSFAVPLVISGAVLIHTFVPLKSITPEKDRTGKFKALYEMSQDVAENIQANSEHLPVFAPNYQWTAYLRFQKIAANQLYPSGRMSHFTMVPKRACDHPAIFVIADREEQSSFAPAVDCFKNKQVVKEFPLLVRGTELTKYFLYRYSK